MNDPMQTLDVQQMCSAIEYPVTQRLDWLILLRLSASSRWLFNFSEEGDHPVGHSLC
jgi:hypothetical protein